MIHSILITGGNEQEREQKAFQVAEKYLGKKLTNHPDFILLEAQDSIKISQVRDLQKKLQFKPYSATIKVAFIQDASLLTVPAQHSLLKTLEEPPAASVILMTTQNKESLLPTILSRCQIIPLLDKPTIINDQQLITNQIIKSSPGQRLLIAENYTQTREKSQEFCQQQLVFWRHLLGENNLSCQTIRQILQALSLLKANVNFRLALENLLLSYPK